MAAASSLLNPRAIACQNDHRPARYRTGGRPGGRNFVRMGQLPFLFFLSINTSVQDVLRRGLNPPCHRQRRSTYHSSVESR